MNAAPQATASGASEVTAQHIPQPIAKAISIPRLTAAPKFEDFADMAAHGNIARQMAHISDFTENSPNDGIRPTQRTEVYLGYTHDSLYVVWLCFDTQADAIRAHMDAREQIYDDDFVQLTIDAFHDQRHAFVFAANPLGIQAEGLWTEGSGNSNPDNTWDTTWNSSGHVTTKGYIVFEQIPFRSLRFRGAANEDNVGLWGVTLMRSIARNGEQDYWPYVSAHVNGLLNQEGTAAGIGGVEAGHAFEIIPYGIARSFHALDTTDPLTPRYSDRLFNGKVGIDDAKVVFHNSLVLDATINPDFAQVESDQPQNTVNQRFAVFFPEKRPFFLENANYFNVQGSSPLGGTNSQLVFTRQIADPDAGLRLTGKVGGFNIGVMTADDKAPGESVAPSSPYFGDRAQFYIARVSYDLGQNSSIGAIYIDREFAGNTNRVGGIDGNYRFNKQWNLSFRAIVSSTNDATAGYQFGQDDEAELDGQGEHFYDVLSYTDITPNFIDEAGFIRRTDQRRISNYYHFYWKPNKKHLTLHGPELSFDRIWDHTQRPIEYSASFDWAFGLRNNTIFAPIVAVESDTLRPQDFPGLTFDRKFIQDAGGFVLRTAPSHFFSTSTTFMRDGVVDIVVPNGQLPTEADETSLNQTVTLHPSSGLTIANTYIWDRVDHDPIHRSVFNNHIIRSQANYQFNRQLSFRFIAQYNGLLANPQYSSLTTAKNMNFDFLMTYLVHPGTAIYVGYNSNLENIDRGLCLHVAGTTECDPNGVGLLRTPDGLVNDGKQVFIKISYLLRR